MAKEIWYLVTVSHGKFMYCVGNGPDRTSAEDQARGFRNSIIGPWEDKAMRKKRRGAKPEVCVWKLVTAHRPDV